MKKSWSQYLQEKRVEVLKTVKPILEPFDITEVDYVIDENTKQEILVIEKAKIDCSCNSIEAIIQEVVGYLFIKTWVPSSRILYYDPHVNHCIEMITHYWIKEE